MTHAGDRTRATSAETGAGDSGQAGSTDARDHDRDRGFVHLPPAGWRSAPDGGRPRPTACRHLDEERPAPSRLPVTGCAECLAAGRQDWVHLRICLDCGHNGCCDSSAGAHAWKHAAGTGHPIAVAVEEPWAWCYADEVFLVPDSAGPDVRSGTGRT
ncbi:UBP-type zinc finger domain-containing protein [Streptomyces sp. NPDC059385]|uniref:UBP-type zinc finger domain-containing protein n=1 Tax=Streptomyces sp. NPDC059385 TaxID=3346817 RepID=UPI0036768AD6